MSKIAILHPKATIKWWAIKTLFEIWNIFNENEKNEIKFFVLELDRGNCFPELNQNLQITTYQSKWWKRILAFLKIAFSLRNFDYIIAWNSPMHFVWVFAKIFNPKLKVYWYLQNIPVYYLPQNKSIITLFKKYLEKIAVFFLDKIITNSTFIRDEAKRDFWKDTEILYPSVNTDFFSNDHSAMEENQTIFCYSRLSKGKNVELAIKSYIELQKDHPWLKLIIWWDWEERSKLEEMAQFYPQISFLWEITPERAKEEFAKSTVFLFTSLIDAFWLTILEAMSMEKAVVAMAIWWAKELIGHWENWYLAKNEDEYYLYIDELLRDSEKRWSMWEKWRQWALWHFSKDAMRRDLKNLFKI